MIYTDDYIPKDLMDDEELEELAALEKFKIDEQLEKLTERVQNHLDWAKNSTGRKKRKPVGEMLGIFGVADTGMVFSLLVFEVEMLLERV